MASRVPEIRIRACRDVPVEDRSGFVLYWMTSARRTRWNYAFQRAVEWCRELRRPLVVLETIECDGRWASARHHQFVVEGMVDTHNRLRASGVLYYPYVESRAGAAKRLVEDLAGRACVVVTDDFPCGAVPESQAKVSRSIAARMEVVDSNGLLPMRGADRVFPTAYAFRRFLQQNLVSHLAEPPVANPLAGPKLVAMSALPQGVTRRWAPLWQEDSVAEAELSRAVAVNRSVGPVATRGGSREGESCLSRLLKERLDRYGEDRNLPEREAASGLSPYLHFGHVASHEVFWRIARGEDWQPDRVAPKANGRRVGWWGVSEAAESFLDQLITWRELGYNFAWQREDYARYESLPDWARKTLAEHAGDRRPKVYELEDFEASGTDDPLWNAAQRQLVREGRMHNYLRMLWGKKILEWSATPVEALETMIELNNRYALDGDNPNSYSGICWVLGRYDRAWGPERPIFGKIRYMSSENTLRKIRLRGYLQRYGA